MSAFCKCLKGVVCPHNCALLFIVSALLSLMTELCTDVHFMACQQ